MLKKKTIAIMVLFVLPMFLGITAVAYPGFHSDAECSYCHNATATAYNGAYASEALVLDGADDEAFWDDPYKRRLTVPVAYRDPDTRDVNEMYITMVFAQNATHLFIFMEWDDLTINGTSAVKYDDADGLAICWNIDVDWFNASYLDPNAMTTGGVGTVDCLIWKPVAAATGTQVVSTGPSYGAHVAVSGTASDLSFSTGWATDTQQDWQVGAIHGNFSSHAEGVYMVEIVRALETGEATDVQFDASGNYEFAIAIFNATSGVDHLVSFVQEVYVYNPSDGGDGGGVPGFGFLITLLPLILLAGILVTLRYKREIQ